jgi:hypothetical protein
MHKPSKFGSGRLLRRPSANPYLDVVVVQAVLVVLVVLVQALSLVVVLRQ